MAERNPFTVLGFAPSAFEDLSVEDIRSLVNAQYRALVGLHHPDRRGGRLDRFKEVQEAFDRLKEDFEFDFWKKMFLRKRKDQLVELDKAHHKARVDVKALQEGLTKLWIAFCRKREIFQSAGFETAHPELRGLGGFSVFDPPPVSTLMIDRLASLIRERVREERRKFSGRIPVTTDGVQSGCFELRILPGGLMTRQPLDKTFFDARERWRPPVRPGWIELRSSPPSKSYYWKPEGEPVVLPGILLGSIPNNILSARQEEQKNPEGAKLIPTDISSGEYRMGKDGYTLDVFEPYLRYVQPRVMSGQWVVVAEGSNARDLRFQIIGYARKILPLEIGEAIATTT